MLKDIFEDSHWERHGDYWMLRKEWGLTVAILIPFETIKKELKEDANPASTVRSV
jgi:hypothetical protein